MRAGLLSAPQDVTRPHPVPPPRIVGKHAGPCLSATPGERPLQTPPSSLLSLSFATKLKNFPDSLPRKVGVYPFKSQAVALGQRRSLEPSWAPHHILTREPEASGPAAASAGGRAVPRHRTGVPVCTLGSRRFRPGCLQGTEHSGPRPPRCHEGRLRSSASGRGDTRRDGCAWGRTRIGKAVAIASQQLSRTT